MLPNKEPSLIYIGDWSSLVMALALGARNREFNSLIPDHYADVVQWLVCGLAKAETAVRICSFAPYGVIGEVVTRKNTKRDK